MTWAWVLLAAMAIEPAHYWLGILVSEMRCHCWSASAPAASAEERVSILRVYPRFAVGASDIRVEVKVPKRQSNRSLIFEFECDSGFSRSSAQPLDRERAPLVHPFTLRNVPPGRCVTFAWIATDEGEHGKSYRSTEERVTIYGPGVDAEDIP